MPLRRAVDSTKSPATLPPEVFPTVQKSVITSLLHLSDLCYFRSDFKLIKACVL